MEKKTTEIRELANKLTSEQVIRLANDCNQAIKFLVDDASIDASDASSLKVCKSIKICKKSYLVSKTYKNGKSREERKADKGLSIYGSLTIDNGLVACYKQARILIVPTSDGKNAIHLVKALDDTYSDANRICEMSLSDSVRNYAIDLGLETLNVSKQLDEWKFIVIKACFKAFETIQKFVDYKDIHELLS